MIKSNWIPLTTLVAVLGLFISLITRFATHDDIDRVSGDIGKLDKQVQEVKTDLNEIRVEITSMKSSIDSSIKSIETGMKSEFQTSLQALTDIISVSVRGNLILESKVEDLSKRTDRIGDRVDQATITSINKD